MTEKKSQEKSEKSSSSNKNEHSQNESPSSASIKEIEKKLISAREQLESLQPTDWYVNGGYKNYVSQVMADTPAQVVATIAAQFPVSMTRFQAISRAYELLEMAASAKHAIDSGQVYTTGMVFLEHHGVVENIRREREREKIIAVGDNTNYGRPGPVTERDGKKHYRFNDVLKNLMPKVERVLEREQRFIEWWASTQSVGVKESNIQINTWKQAGLIPADVYKMAYPSWLDWWEDHVSSLRGKVKKEAIQERNAATQNTSAGATAMTEVKREKAVAVQENARQPASVKKKGKPARGR